MFYQLPLGGQSAMSYGLLADGLGLLHAAFVLFVVGGLAAILAGGRFRWRWTGNLAFRVAHLAAIAVVVAQTWLGQLCPLTLWENQLRRLAREEGLGESFVAYWLDRLLYWQLPSWAFLAAYTMFGALVAAAFIWYPPRRRAAMQTRSNDEVLREMVPLAGKRVADIGCGEGALVRLMARAGARVVGVDNNPAQLAKAAEAAAGSETYAMAVGERLPFADATFDAVVVFNALHHIPVEAQRAALVEAARVLRPDGRLYIAEPIAEGANFELTRLVDDETEVRAAAYGAIRSAVAQGVFREERELTYVHPMLSENFESFLARMIRIDPARKPAVARHERELGERYRRLGRPSPKGIIFDQPMRVNLLTLP